MKMMVRFDSHKHSVSNALLCVINAFAEANEALKNVADATKEAEKEISEMMSSSTEALKNGGLVYHESPWYIDNPTMPSLASGVREFSKGCWCQAPVGKFWNTTEFVRKIIVNGNATIVFWSDNTKTVVKWDGEGEWSEYTAFCSALAIKLLGSNSHLKRVIKDSIEYHDVPKTKTKNRSHEEPREFLSGDKVLVRTDLEVGKNYGIIMWTDAMRDAVETALDWVYPSTWLEIERVYPTSMTCKIRGCKDLLFSYEMLEMCKGE